MSDDAKKDLSNIAISRAATDVAERIMVKYRQFDGYDEVEMYAAAWLIKHDPYFDPINYRPLDTSGTNHSFASFDGDGKWSKIIKLFYPKAETPYLCLRALMDKGLLEIGELIDNPSFNLLEDIMK